MAIPLNSRSKIGSLDFSSGPCLLRTKTLQHFYKNEVIVRPTTDLLNRSSNIPTIQSSKTRLNEFCQKGSNHNNLISIKTVNQHNYSSTLKICSFNAQSLGPCCQQKRILVNEFIKDNEIDIMFIQETWFRQSGDEGLCAELAPSNYTAKSFPRANFGGGLAVVFRNSLKNIISIKTNFSFPHKSFEIFQLVLKTTHRPIKLYNIYRTFPSKKNRLNDNDFHTEFTEFLNCTNEDINSDMVIVGDFNFHFDDPSNSNTQKMNDLLDMFELTQSVNGPTQRHGHTLDWVISRSSENVLKNIHISYDLTSDHNCIVCDLLLSNVQKTPQHREFRNIKSINRDEFKKDLEALLPTCDTIEKLQNLLSMLLDKHAPLKLIKVNDKRDPVHESIKEQLQEIKSKKRSSEKKWLKTGLTIHKDIYDSTKKTISKLVQYGRSKYYNSKINRNTTTKELHKICKHLTGATSSYPLPTNYPFEKLPELFSEYFTNKIHIIRSEFDNSVTMNTNTTSDKSDTLNNSSNYKLDVFRPVTEEEVKKIILKAKPTSCNLDPIPTHFFLEIVDEILSTLTLLINDSLENGFFPDSLKSAVIKPLLKKTTLDQNDFKNYRPVSNLSFLSKVLERVVLDQLFEYLNQNNLLSPNQSAYRPRHSTETALIKVTNDILTSLDQGDVTVLSLLDLSSAFDTLDHSILFNVMQNDFSITDTVLNWFKSYLTCRYQSVNICNSFSNPNSLKYGVPQGSVLGPVLFIMYML